MFRSSKAKTISISAVLFLTIVGFGFLNLKKVSAAEGTPPVVADVNISASIQGQATTTVQGMTSSLQLNTSFNASRISGGMEFQTSSMPIASVNPTPTNPTGNLSLPQGTKMLAAERVTATLWDGTVETYKLRTDLTVSGTRDSQGQILGPNGTILDSALIYNLSGQRIAIVDLKDPRFNTVFSFETGGEKYTVTLVFELSQLYDEPGGGGELAAGAEAFLVEPREITIFSGESATFNIHYNNNATDWITRSFNLGEWAGAFPIINGCPGGCSNLPLGLYPYIDAEHGEDMLPWMESFVIGNRQGEPGEPSEPIPVGTYTIRVNMLGKMVGEVNFYGNVPCFGTNNGNWVDINGWWDTSPPTSSNISCVDKVLKGTQYITLKVIPPGSPPPTVDLKINGSDALPSFIRGGKPLTLS